MQDMYVSLQRHSTREKRRKSESRHDLQEAALIAGRFSFLTHVRGPWSVYSMNARLYNALADLMMLTKLS